MDSGKIDINGVKIYYEIRGEGHPLLMIMGLSANSSWWPPELLDELADKYMVITFDNRGTGQSTASEDPFTVESMADDAVALLNSLGVDKAHILGISMGGMIAQELTLKYPERVGRLVLCATAPGGAETVLDEEIIGEMVQSNFLPPKERVKFTLKVLFTESFVAENPEMVDDYLKRISRYPMEPAYIMRQTEAVTSFSSYSRLGEIKAPTLIIGGMDDRLLPPENSRMIAEKIPDAQLLLLENTAHGVMTNISVFLPAVTKHLGA